MENARKPSPSTTSTSASDVPKAIAEPFFLSDDLIMINSC
jgi:hypothetical protein